MVARRSREVLVIHPGALGDVLQAVPALTALRALEEGIRLTFAGQRRLGRLLLGIGLVDAALPFDELGLENLFGSDPVPPSVHPRLACFHSVISWFGARAEPFPGRLRAIVTDTLLAPPVPETGPPPTVWEHLVATLELWGVTAPPRLAPLSLPEAWRAEAREVLRRLGWDSGQRLLIVHPGAGAEWKRWPAANFAQVIRQVALKTACQVLIHEGPADSGAADALFRAVDFPALHLLEPPLHLLTAVLQEAEAYLGADSGVSHLAAAVGAPAVILFSSATRARWAPWSPTALPLEPGGGLNEIESIARAISERLNGEHAESTRNGHYAETLGQALLKVLEK